MQSRGRKEIGKVLPSPGKIKPSDILAIPLGGGVWGYMRALRDASVAILSPISKGKLLDLSEIKNAQILGYSGYCEPWDFPTWVYLGKWSFENPEDCWPPPNYIIDVLNPLIVKIYHKGVMKPAKDRSEYAGMDQNQGLLFPGMLVIRIRELHRMASTRSDVEKFAPFTSNWEPPKC
jgi:hypothetical protein